MATVMRTYEVWVALKVLAPRGEYAAVACVEDYLQTVVDGNAALDDFRIVSITRWDEDDARWQRGT